MGPGGPRGLQSRCEARRTSRVCSIRTHLRQRNHERPRLPRGLGAFHSQEIGHSSLHSQKYLLLTILSNCLVCSQCRHKRHSPPILLLRAIDPIPYANRLSSTKAVANRDNSSTCKEVNRLS